MPPLKKRKLLSVSRFLDISAAEGDDEESDGLTEEEDEEEGHLDDGASDEDIEDGDAARDTPKWVSTEDSHSPSAEELVQDVISRYRASNTLDSHPGLSDAMHLFLQPTDEDSPLWVCKVKAGYETDIVLSIFERSGGPDLLSAFALPSRSGLVYIEALSFSQALNSLFRASDLCPLYPGVINNEVPRIVPLDECLASLISLPPSHSISVLSFIRVNDPRSIYNGDIGFAARNNHDGWIQIAIVPRITLHETGMRPNPVLFDVNDYLDESFEFLDDGHIAWDSSGLLFYQGFMITEFRDTSLSNLFIHDPILT
ncbi:hypothetical protein HETIRDRAFT_422839 [Heterobasidion irregulare TC 32-1]|uniref:Uncharacterized protein n=1 Tax=Heterobasidion irregulare (strain TC 32-1) TaxID=747525 RepID=W4JPT0_HETIT|nr:uncharacterized protein HETIRDRAFT_422839 [Heterobasidion irregulare TC 32-1]ETW75090.1 hypothetical protein HETIRDRAFT_422839 [Heterobasidion irregulare TC 32-1]